MKFDQYLTDEIAVKNKLIRNRVFLGSFLAVCIFTLLMKLADGVLLDLGFRAKHVNINFWTSNNVERWVPSAGTKYYASAIEALNHHPNTIWFMTQFTWLTTFIIIIFLIIRFFQINDSVPKWLRWVMTQRTLTRVTIYDFIVGAVYWSSLSRQFKNSFNPDLMAFEFIITASVHALIPLLSVVYAIIFLSSDPKGSILKEKFVLKSMTFPAAYSLIYVLSTIIWDDPYPITSMHESLNGGHWDEWARELWKIPAALFGIYAIIGALTMIHNILLLKFNKNYDPTRDFEALERRDAKIAKIRLKVENEFTREIKLDNKMKRKNKQ